MTLLEFLLVLISVVIGLGMAAILTGASGILRSRDHIVRYWLHTLFQVGIFLALIQQWWETWELRGLGALSFWAVLTLLATPIILFVIADLLYPKPLGKAELRAYYYRQAPMLWGLVFLAIAVGTVVRPLALGTPLVTPGNLLGLPMMLLCGVLTVSDDSRVHSVVGPFMLLMLIVDTLVAGSAISMG